MNEKPNEICRHLLPSVDHAIVQYIRHYDYAYKLQSARDEDFFLFSNERTFDHFLNNYLIA